MNGTPTSYMDTFKNAYEHMSGKLSLVPNQDIWADFGVYSSQLDVDESEDINKTWEEIAKLVGKDVTEVKNDVAPVKDMYILLDHTRTALMTICDGSLPSNNGGGANIRNILRRVFAIIEKNDWWGKIGGIEGLLECIQYHKPDMEGIFGEFREYKSFDQIVRIEWDRYQHTDTEQTKTLQRLIKQRKGQLSTDDFILAMQSWGIPADKISAIAKQEIPVDLYYKIAEMAE